jgi:hypothetical protein
MSVTLNNDLIGKTYIRSFLPERNLPVAILLSNNLT